MWSLGDKSSKIEFILRFLSDMGDTEIRIYICNSDSKNRMSVLVSKAQEGVLSGVELRSPGKIAFV